MKTKSLFTLFAAFLFSISLVSAVTMTLSDVPSSVNHDDSSFDITVTLESDDTVNPEDVTLGSTGLSALVSGVSFSLPNDVTVDANETIVLTATVSYDALNEDGTLNGFITASGTSDEPFSVSIADATTLEIEVLSSLTATQDGEIQIRNTGNQNINSVALTDIGGAINVTFTPASIGTTIAPGAVSGSITITATNLDDVDFGGQSVTIEAVGTPGGSDTQTFSVSTSFCSAGEQGGKLEITDVDLTNRGNGDDDNEWFFLDVIEVDVDVENTDNDDDVDEVHVELGLFDENGNDVTNDLDFENDDDEDIDVGRIRDGDEETVTFRFRVPADFDEGEYELVVKAYDDDNNFGEDVECTEEVVDSISVDPVDEYDQSIVVDDIILDSSQVSCGEGISGSFVVYNIGDDSEERVQIILQNSDLGLEEEFEILDDFDEGDDQRFSFNFIVPNNVDDGRYNLAFRTFFDYRRGIYTENSDRSFVVPIEVLGCEGSFEDISNTPVLVISAQLASDAAPGQELIVEAQLRNNGDEFISVAVDAQGFENWGSLQSVAPGIVPLNPGQSNVATFRFEVDEDATGTQTFIIQARDTGSNQMLQVQELQVFFGGEESSDGLFDFSGSGLIWAIGIVNVLLVLLIIVVAVRLSRR